MDYLALQASAAEGIRSAGSKVKITRNVVGDFNEETGKVGFYVPHQWECFALKGSLGKLTKYAQTSTKRATLISAGAIMLTLEAIPGYIPQVGDVITMQDGQWVVEDADSLSPGQVDLLFTVLIRR